MAITFDAAGTGASTATSGAALTPTVPATINAGDILITHVAWNDTSSTPSTPSGWMLLDGPRDIGTLPNGRHWIFGKVADGTEDGTSPSYGTAGGTAKRWGRVYRFLGRTSGSIGGLVSGFSPTSHATDPQMPTVSTTKAGALAVACVAQTDDNTIASATLESGGDWVEAVAEFTATTGTGVMMQLQTCTPTGDPGTVSGGSASTANDPCGVIGFQITADAFAESDASAAGVATPAIAAAALWLVTLASAGLAGVTSDGATVITAMASSAATSTVAADGEDAQGSTTDADGTSAGVATVSGVGGATAQSDASTAGAVTVSGVGTSIAHADANAPGVATVSGVGAAPVAVIASSSGSAAVAGLSSAVAGVVGSSTGVATVTGDSQDIGGAGSDAVSAGTSTAAAASQATVAVTASTTGTAVVDAVSATIATGQASASGVGAAMGVSSAVAGVVMNAAGGATVLGEGENAGFIAPGEDHVIVRPRITSHRVAAQQTSVRSRDRRTSFTVAA